MARLTVYVPKNPKPFGIKRGSGVVGEPAEHSDGMVRIYYEGNLYNAENIRTYEDKLLHAAGRLVQRYPTVARAYIADSDLTAVGEYETDNWRFMPSPDPEAQQALAAWLGESCKKCGSALDADGYCADQACPFSDWPQQVDERDLYESPTSEVERKYRVRRRSVL